MTSSPVNNPLPSTPMATPHFTKEDKTAIPEGLSRLSRPDLTLFCKGLLKRVQELEKLVDVISRGKYIWEATFDAIGEPVMIVDAHYVVRRANLNVAKVSENPITNVVGQKCYRVFAHRESPCPQCPLQEMMQTGELSEAHLGNKIKSHDYVAHAYPLHDENGELQSAVMYYHNVTEELRLKQEVIQQEKMAAIGMLAGGVAHEVNNPLGGVLAFTQLLLRKTENNREIYEDLKEVERAATRCKKIVQELLDFSRVSKDREKTLVDVNILLEKVIPFVQMEMRSLNIGLELKLAPRLPNVFAPPNRLQQVFLNLMTNACHAMIKGGKLTLTTLFDDRAGEVCIRFCDTGTGISKEVREKIFEPFFTTKDPGKGTGLGLSISYRIVSENGGRMEVSSEKERGATFTVRLPAAN